MIWTGTVEQLTEFMTRLNSISPDLKVTYSSYTEGVEFLDVFGYAADNFIRTKLFSKKSDTHCNLIATSWSMSHEIYLIVGSQERVRKK